MGHLPRGRFALGENELIIHYDGKQWEQMESPPHEGGTLGDIESANLKDVMGTGPNSVIAVGSPPSAWGVSSRVLHYDGNSWTQIDGPSIYTLRSVWCGGPDDVFVLVDREIWRSAGSFPPSPRDT